MPLFRVKSAAVTQAISPPPSRISPRLVTIVSVVVAGLNTASPGTV